MITFNSPLRLLPPGLEPRQVMILDGIRHAAEVGTLALRRLRQDLTVIATRATVSGTQLEADQRTAAYLDAWAVVDAIDRLRMLIQLLPMSQKDRAAHEEQTAKLQGIRNVRNVADHLAQRIDYVLAHGAPALGALGWFTLTGEKEGVSCMLRPGTFFTNFSATVVNPAGKDFHPPTDHVTLIAGEHRVSLTEAADVARGLVLAVERGLSATIVKHDLGGQHAGADMLIKAEMKFQP